MTAKKNKTWKPALGQPLGPQEQRLVDALDGKSFSNVRFLFARVTGTSTKIAEGVALRVAQQKIGAVVARYNQKRKGHRIVPGPHPGTYKVTRIRPERERAKQ